MWAGLSGIFVIAFLVLAAVTILAFPFVGLALLPVMILAVLALIGWGYMAMRRGPAGVPERTTSPSEPEELGRHT